MKNKKIAIGIDVGATDIKMGLIHRSGRVVSKTQFLTGRFMSKNAFVRAISRQIKQFIKYNSVSGNDIIGIGIGLPGTVDYEKGIVNNLTNIRGIKRLPLRKILRKFFKYTICIDNDVNAFANGQLKWGLARGVKNAICITLGTGVGGGLIINGSVYRGSNYSAGEIGHICMDINGPKCGCGSNGCLEVFVGNNYIIKNAIKKIKAGKRTSLVKKLNGDLFKLTPEIITHTAKAGDVFSKNIWKEAGEYLGAGLGGLVNVLNPEIIIIGGGVSKAGNFIFAPLKKELARHTMSQHLKVLKVVGVKFVSDAGILGAASLVVK